MKPNALAEVSRQISQLVAKSWLSNDPEGAEINAVLQEGNSNNIKLLFKKYGIDLDGLLQTNCFKIAVDSFCNGSIEAIPGSDGTMTVNIPLPPRPNDVALTDEVITCWIDGSVEPERVYSSDRYIARLTSS